jgi:hypothetical protein
MRAAMPGASEGSTPTLPDRLTAEDLTTLVILYLLQLGEAAGTRYLRQFRAAPRVSMTTGAPVDHLDRLGMGDLFARMARVAYDAFRNAAPSLVEGLRTEDAIALLHESRRRVEQRGSVRERREWVRSEAEAALLWPFFSPAVAEGLYASVDIGAGSTDATFFRITSIHEGGAWRKDKIAFLGANARPPGMDAVGHVIARDVGVALHDVRGQEDHLVTGLSPNAATAVANRQDEIASVYVDAFRDGYQREPGAGAWQGYGLFRIGGGSKFAPLRRHVAAATVWPGQVPPGRLLDPGQPADLQTADGAPFRQDATFLLVAYGLSYFAGEVPRVINPTEVQPLRIERPLRRIEQDDWYPD